MTNSKKKKNKKWVLAAALLLAGVIAVGGTFAWFTSTDEVTNRLTASGSYGVSVTESFTPPEQWTPGQSIKKEVAAVNTGNVAAYVKLDLTDEMSVTAETNVSVYSITSSGSSIIDTVTAADDYVVLSEDEVISLEAGGQLVYMSNLQKVVTETKDVATGEVTKTITYKIKDTTTVVDTTVTAGEYYKTITTTGLYVFARKDPDENTVYSGYYVVVDGSSKTFYKVDLSGLTLTESQNSSSVVDSVTTTIFDIVRGDFNFVKETTYSTADSTATITFSGSMYAASATYTSTATSKKGDGYVTSSQEKVFYIQAVYDPDGTSSTGDEIIINIALAGTWTKDDSGSPTVWKSDDWTAVYDSSEDKWTFYYNHVLSAGTTSDLLVTDMQLDTSVTNGAYTEFTYDLIVNLESVQVVAAETYENGITLIETPSSSITWEQKVGNSTYAVSETISSTVSGSTIYSNEYGQVCTSKGDTSNTYGSKNNYLTWSFN